MAKKRKLGKQSKTETPTKKKSKTETPTEEKSKTKKPTEEKSRTKKQTEKKSKTKTPAEKKSKTEKPTEKKSKTKTPKEKKTKTPKEKKSKTETPAEKKFKPSKSLEDYDEEPQRRVDLADSDDAEPASDSGSADDLADLLEPFAKPQLIELISDAAVRDSSLLRRLHELADRDAAHRNIFVHGLPWDTTKEALESAFVRFGEIEACHVAIDKNTRKAKGYGFVLFKTRKEAARALKNPNKKINNRVATCQLASIGPPAPAPPSSSSAKPDSASSWRKIYVANVPPETDVVRFREFFAKFGEIEEGPIGFDFQTGKSRGFALFVYKTVEGFEKALQEPNKIFEGHRMHCQKAAESKAKAKAVVGQPQPQPQPQPQAPQPIPMPMPMPMPMPHNMAFFNPMMFMNPMGMFPAGHFGGYAGMGGNLDSAAKGSSELQLGSASSGAAGYGSSYLC